MYCSVSRCKAARYEYEYSYSSGNTSPYVTAAFRRKFVSAAPSQRIASYSTRTSTVSDRGRRMPAIQYTTLPYFVNARTGHQQVISRFVSSVQAATRLQRGALSESSFWLSFDLLSPGARWIRSRIGAQPRPSALIDLSLIRTL